MSIRLAHRVSRLRARQTHPQGEFDAAVEPAAERAARTALGDEGAARPEMSRQERVIFTVYVVVAILIVLFLAATGLLWWLGG
jgi:hypothetical protein